MITFTLLSNNVSKCAASDDNDNDNSSLPSPPDDPISKLIDQYAPEVSIYYLYLICFYISQIL
jgi:hypothetical protein